MKLHVPSFLLGAGAASVAFGARAALRPVLVEVGALAVHAWRVGVGAVMRERERFEDLWADVEEAARRAAREASQEPAAQPPVTH